MIPQFSSVGAIPVVYDGYAKALPFILSLGKIDDICLHAWPSPKVRTAVADIRSRNADTKVTLGVGVDSLARSSILSGNTSVAVKEFERVVRTAMDYNGGIQAVMWNAEASWKRPPNSAEKRLLSKLVKDTLNNIAENFPDLPQLHTAYDHPTYHSTYNWEDWLGKDSPICMSLPQVYAAPEGGVMARRGGLDRREATALSSWATAVRKGWIRPDAPEGSPEDLKDVDWAPYYQLHHVPVADTLRHMTSAQVSFGWAIPTRSDKDGETAIKCAIILRRNGFWGSEAVKDWQVAHGLTADNIAGWGQTIPSILAAAKVGE